ncbi:MAG: hypothetical protein JSR61_04700 [Proteobacteria bacterium]|nr:hypothetical protein [Pseudomonadota bacterium]
MKNFGKIAVAAALVGATALATATPSEARNGRNTAAAIGFGAGALVGAAAASSANNGYYYGSGYYEPGYTYEPDYAYDGYAYEPAPGYMGPRYYGYRGGNVSTDDSRCGGNPASPGYTPCANQ